MKWKLLLLKFNKNHTTKIQSYYWSNTKQRVTNSFWLLLFCYFWVKSLAYFNFNFFCLNKKKFQKFFPLIPINPLEFFILRGLKKQYLRSMLSRLINLKLVLEEVVKLQYRFLYTSADAVL